MKTLELNQLKNYLGTGLVIQREGLNPLTTDFDLELDLSAVEMMIHGGYKPHFYPLSMLTEEIEHPVTGEKFVPIDMFRHETSSQIIEDLKNGGQLDFELPFCVISQLIQWHFWIFDQGDFGTLVIDKSKIN